MFIFFFFNDTATTEIYTLSLHDALPISLQRSGGSWYGHLRAHCRRRERAARRARQGRQTHGVVTATLTRSEEHTSELQSRSDLVCRLLLEKKKKQPHRGVHRRRSRHDHA